jgi:hypothetical protein
MNMKQKPASSTEKMLDFIRESAETIRTREPNAPVIKVPKPQTIKRVVLSP